MARNSFLGVVIFHSVLTSKRACSNLWVNHVEAAAMSPASKKLGKTDAGFGLVNDEEVVLDVNVDLELDLLGFCFCFCFCFSSFSCCFAFLISN